MHLRVYWGNNRAHLLGQLVKQDLIKLLCYWLVIFKEVNYELVCHCMGSWVKNSLLSPTIELRSFKSRLARHSALAMLDWMSRPSSVPTQPLHLRHSFRGSSLQSLQSCSWLHTFVMSMHSPLLHLNFPEPKHWLTAKRNTEERLPEWVRSGWSLDKPTRTGPYHFCSWLHQNRRHSLGCHYTACCHGCSYHPHIQTGLVGRFEKLQREETPWDEASQVVPSGSMEENRTCHTDENATYDSWPHRCHPCSPDLRHIATSCGCTRQSHTGSRWLGTWCASLAGGHTAAETHQTGPSSRHHRHTPSWGGCRRRRCTGTRGHHRTVGHSWAHHCHRYSHPGHCTQNSWRCSGRWSKWTRQSCTLCCLLRESPIESASGLVLLGLLSGNLTCRSLIMNPSFLA